MAARDLIAQLHQDITTADDAGDRATADRLRAELAVAVESDQDRETPYVTGVAPQAQDPADTDAAFVRRGPEDPGPGSYEQSEGIATDVPGAVAGRPAEPPD